VSLHGHFITLTSPDSNIPLPPDCVFDWHYAQCVLKQFATADYRNVANIYYPTRTFRTEDEDYDDDFEFDDERNIQDPPYPSYFEISTNTGYFKS